MPFLFFIDGVLAHELDLPAYAFLLDDRAGLPAAHMLERRDGRTDMYHIGGGEL